MLFNLWCLSEIVGLSLTITHLPNSHLLEISWSTSAPLPAEIEEWARFWKSIHRKRTAAWVEENCPNFISSECLQKQHLCPSLKDPRACFSPSPPLIDFTRNTRMGALARKDELCVEIEEVQSQLALRTENQVLNKITQPWVHKIKSIFQEKTDPLNLPFGFEYFWNLYIPQKRPLSLLVDFRRHTNKNCNFLKA